MSNDISCIMMGDLPVVRSRPCYSTEGGERFPVSIGFSRRISDEEFKALAAYAMLIEKGVVVKKEEE